MHKKVNALLCIGVVFLLLGLTFALAAAENQDELEDIQKAYSTDWSNIEHEIDTWLPRNHHRKHANVRVWWKSDFNEVTFRVEALTKGYVGLGIIKHSKQNKKLADLMVGWVKDGEAVIQDRYETSKQEFRLDRQQNVELVGGFENKTHTTLIFKRKHDTCDRDDDIAITNDTTRIFYILHANDPADPNDIFLHNDAQEVYASVLITSRPSSMTELSSHWSTFSQDDQATTDRPTSQQQLIPWDLINYKVVFPRDEEELYLCKVYQLPGNISVKHHVIGYEPIIQSGSEAFLHRIFIYSCHPTDLQEENELDDLSALNAERCPYYNAQSQGLLRKCHTLFIVWTIGSKGILFPENVGLTVDPELGPRHLLVETHYHNLNSNLEIKDNSGIRLWCSPKLRIIEAGLMSLGIEPNWKHIVPPMTSSVISYGHCVGQCTASSFPLSGINVFGAVLHSQSLGRKISLRHIRNETELLPIAEDNFYDSRYQEIHRFIPKPIFQGDHLVVECTYNSKGRYSMAVGGFKSRDETCLAYIYYYPKVNISICQSILTLSSTYASMGIEEMWEGHDPPLVKRPVSSANITLAEYIANHEWSKHMTKYKNAIRNGLFDFRCGNSSLQTKLNTIAQKTTASIYPTIKLMYNKPKLCQQSNLTKETSIVEVTEAMVSNFTEETTLKSTSQMPQTKKNERKPQKTSPRPNKKSKTIKPTSKSITTSTTTKPSINTGIKLRFNVEMIGMILIAHILSQSKCFKIS